jgi:hypothetical protein
MSSASSAVRAGLEAYLAGGVSAQAVAALVGAALYGEGGVGRAAALRPLIDVIERAAPGVVALERLAGAPGFTVAPGERPFPREHEAALRAAAVAVLASLPAASGGAAGLLGRMWSAVQRLFGR